MINFSNFFITPPKTFQFILGVAGKRNTDFVRFVTILPIFAAKRPNRSLKDVVKELRDKNLISPNCEDMLNHTFEIVPLELIKRVKSNKKSGKGRVYSPELKSFALTLQFYSSKAYSFLRKTFNLALPSQSQIRRWYSKIAADPGFTEPAFNALKLKAEEAKENGKEVLCSLMLDEMSIKNMYHGMDINIKGM